MKRTKAKRGITLIALIITIVVLLIIAVVAVSVVEKSNIIGHAKKAADDYNSSKDDEKDKLSGYEDFMEKYANGGSGTENGESSNPEQDENQNPDDKEENDDENPPQQTDMPIATVEIIVSENSTINGEMYSSTNPIIPAGFKAINVATEGNESNWDAVGGPEVDKGLVIQDELGNEFVWVPVIDDISTTEYISGTNYKEPATVGLVYTDGYENPTYTYDAVEANLERANCEDIDKDGMLELLDFETELKNNYKSMAESINKYNGFYVGRYETSRNGANPQSKRSIEVSGTGNEIVTAYNSSAENDWYGLYALNKKYSTSSVQGSMIWGVQYDKMMDWMGSAAETTISGANQNRTCGTATEDVIKNVYDIYGNSLEFTLETDITYGRVYRSR